MNIGVSGTEMAIQYFLSLVDVDITASAISSIPQRLTSWPGQGKQHWLLVRLCVPPWSVYLRSWVYDRLQFSVFFCVFFFSNWSLKACSSFESIFFESGKSEIKTFLEHNIRFIFFYLKLTKQTAVTTNGFIFTQLLFLKIFMSKYFLSSAISAMIF